MARFKVHAVAHDDDAVEGQPGLGAVPGDELVDGVLVNSARSWRAEAVEHRQFAMIQVWKPKHSATVIRLDSVFAHGDGLPCRRIELRQTVWAMQAWAPVQSWRDSERYRLGFDSYALGGSGRRRIILVWRWRP